MIKQCISAHKQYWGNLAAMCPCPMCRFALPLMCLQKEHRTLEITFQPRKDNRKSQMCDFMLYIILMCFFTFGGTWVILKSGSDYKTAWFIWSPSFLLSFHASFLTASSCYHFAMPVRLQLNLKYTVYTEAAHPLDTELWERLGCTQCTTSTTISTTGSLCTKTRIRALANVEAAPRKNT